MKYIDFIKQGNLATDIAAGIPGTMALNYAINPAIGPASSVGGALAGILTGPSTDTEENNWDKEKLKALIPGVSSYRNWRRLMRQNKSDNGSNKHTWSQLGGPLSSGLLTALTTGAIGAGIGALSNSKNRRAGAVGGGLAGAAIGGGLVGGAHLLASLLALAKPTRTKEQQREYANSPITSELTIPGVSTYNIWKSLGRSMADSKERAEAEEKKNKK